MTHYKLIYFNLRARGELARLIFAYKGQKYEDYRIGFSDWPLYKSTTPTGKVPILEINEGGNIRRLCQSRAICRYLANTFCLAGKTNYERAKADEIVDQINDEFDIFGRTHILKDEQARKSGFDRLYNTIVPLNLKYFENILQSNNNGFPLIGTEITWADLALSNKWDFIREKEKYFEKFPLVRNHDIKIRSIPQIAEWLNKRPVTKQ